MLPLYKCLKRERSAPAINVNNIQLFVEWLLRVMTATDATLWVVLAGAAAWRSLSILRREWRARALWRGSQTSCDVITRSSSWIKQLICLFMSPDTINLMMMMINVNDLKSTSGSRSPDSAPFIFLPGSVVQTPRLIRNVFSNKLILFR